MRASAEVWRARGAASSATGDMVRRIRVVVGEGQGQFQERASR